MALRFCFCAVGLLLVASSAPSAFAQRTIHVPADQSSIQSGINAAANGDTVLVSPGTYYENIDFLGKAVTVTSSGGAATTIIDGGSKPGSATVAFKSRELRTSILSGFTVQHGGTQTATSQASGGVYAHGAAPTIQDNIVVANRCSGILASGGALIQGNTVTGTLYQNSPGLPDLDGYCQQGGAGIYVGGTGAVGTYTHVEVVGNTVSNNIQALSCGGIEIAAAESTLVQNNIIRNNSSSYVGGIEAFGVQSVSIIDNLIYGNSAGVGNGPGHAGGLQLSGPLSIVAGNTFFGNTLASGASGESASQVNLDTAVNQIVLTNNIIVGSSSSFAALNCSVNYRGANPTPVFDHNDVYNSTGPTYGGACSSQTGLSGNISADPLFVSQGSDFHLMHSSPAIDSGNNNEPGIPSTDLDGIPRIQDATQKGYPVVDMGAYEYPGSLDALFLTSLTSSLNPASYGQSVTFNVTVTATSQGAGTPSGTITFSDGAAILAIQPLMATGLATASAQFISSTLTVGSHPIMAVYDTSANLPASHASLTQIITGIATTTSLSSSANPASYGQAVTLTASVIAAAGSGAPVGTIRFLDGASVLGTLQLTPSGALISSAALTSSSLLPGVHTLSAVYDGSNVFSSSFSLPLAVLIDDVATQTTLVANPNPAYQGQAVQFSIQVTTGIAGVSATGQVLLTDLNSSVSAILTLMPDGTARFTTSTLAPGLHKVTAVYAGSPTAFLGSQTAAPLAVIVLPQDFSLSVSPSALLIRAEHHATLAISLGSIGNFSDKINLSCANLPAIATCTFDQAAPTLPQGGSANVNVIVDTDAVLRFKSDHLIPPTPSNTRFFRGLSLATLLPIGLLLVARRRARLPRSLFTCFILWSASLALSGCSGKYPDHTPLGTYTFSIAASGANTGRTHTIPVILTVTSE